MRVSRFLLISAFALGLSSTFAFAQPKPLYSPSSTHIFPAGAQRGTSLDVYVGAECIPPGTKFEITGHGVSAPEVLGERDNLAGEPSPRRRPTQIPITFPRDWQSKVSIADDTPLGPVFWRLHCAQGGTASRPFIVGDLPEFIETESNSSFESAEHIELPVTVNGRIHGERDLDYFRFFVEAGKTVTVDVMARRLGSRLDPIAEILDQTGQRASFETVRAGDDFVFVLTPDSPGEFVLRISNVTHHGSPGHVYRINVTSRPYISHVFPSGWQAGKRQEFEFTAVGNSGKANTFRRTVSLPELSDEQVPLRFDEFANDVEIQIDGLPHVLEQPGNDSLDSAMSITLPHAVHGRFETETDEDWFAFEQTKGGRLSVSCEAPYSTSVTLPELTLFDAEGKELKAATCVNEVDGIARLEWAPPRNGVVHLRVRDLRHGAVGGPEHIYRLNLEQTQPGFAMTFEADNLNVIQGKTSKLAVVARRFGGFDETIEVTFEGLPEGVTIKKAEISPKEQKATLELAAADNARTESIPIQVFGSAMLNGNIVKRRAKLRHLGADSEGVSVGSPFVDLLHLTVCHQPVFKLYCAEAYLYAHRGSIFPYLMEFERLNGFDGEITLQMADRQNRDPDGIQMIPTTVPAGKSKAWLPIYLPETMHINVQSQSQLYSQAYATFTDEYGQEQAILVLSEKRNMLRTLPPVVKLKALENEIAGKPGEIVRCKLHLERTSNFPGPMTVTLRDADDNLEFALKSAFFPAGATEAEVAVRIKEGTKLGTKHSLVFRAIGDLDGKSTIVSEATITFVVQ